MTRFSTLLGAALAIAHATAAAQTLENAALRLEVSPQSGSIVSLVDKRSGVQLISDPADARLFQLMLPPIGERTRRILSWNQAARTSRPGPAEIEIHFEGLKPDEAQYIFGSGVMHFPETPLNIAATVRLRLDGDHLIARIRLDNRSHETVTGVIFPYIGGLPQQHETGPARIVLPSLGQRTYLNTMGAFSGERAQRYPALLATSWLNFELGAQSLGIEARSPPQAQDAWFALSPGHFQPGSAYRRQQAFPFIAWISWPHLAAQSEWSSPELWIHVHGSDWHRVAAEHREWHRTGNQAADSTAWNDRLGFATYRLKRADNSIDWRYRDLERLAADAATAGIDRLVIEGWREREGPGNPAPHGEIADPRLGGAEALHSAISGLADRGIDLVFAFHPTLINVFADRYPSPEESWAVRTSRDAAQIPVDFLMSTMDYPLQAHHSHYRMEIDPASPASEFLLGEAARLQAEYGIRNLLLKGVGQRAFLSYNRLHGIAPQDAYRVGYERFLGRLREQFGDGILLTEGFNDLVNPFGDGAYTWDQSHDASILPYSMPWRLLSNDVEALDYRAANASFAHKALINLIVDAGAGSVGRYPEFAAHLRALQSLKAATGPYYANAEFRDHDGLRQVESSGDTRIAVFRNARDGRTGIVLANLAEEAAQVTFELEQGASNGQGRLYRPDELSGVAVPLVGPVEAELKPFEVAILGFDDWPNQREVSAAYQQVVITP